ncbi:MAG: ammonium transporter [Bacteroidota bacterium]
MSKKFGLITFSIIILIALISVVFPFLPGKIDSRTINSADTAWMLTSTALVLIMTPGLAFFYGGMVNKKNVLSTMLQSFICMAVISIIWFIIGFSLSFGDSIYGVIGNPKTFFMMQHVIDGTPWKLAPTIPLILFAFYQMKFAIITPALITGAFAERIKFKSYLIFITLFCIFIYCPLAHATWHPNGLLSKLGVVDFAGGVVVHMSAGWAALAGAIFIKSSNESVHNPARITYVMLGTGLLWFGWIGFNSGSAFHADSIATLALGTTSTSSAAAAFTWIVFDSVRGRKPGAMGACIGAIVGLVAITPAAGFVTIPQSFVIGVVSSVISSLMVSWRSTKTTIDDTLDVFSCHGVGGMVGMLLTGVFANHNINPIITHDGLLYGQSRLFLVQLSAMVGVSLFAFFGTFLLLKLTNKISPLRVSDREEKEGLDWSQHDEKL